MVNKWGKYIVLTAVGLTVVLVASIYGAIQGLRLHTSGIYIVLMAVGLLRFFEGLLYIYGSIGGASD